MSLAKGTAIREGAPYVGGWYIPTPLKNDGLKVSWDDDIPNIWKNKIHVPNHQPVYIYIYAYIYIYHVGFNIKLNGPFSPSISQLNPRVTNSLFGKGSCQGSWKRCHRNRSLTGCSWFIESFWNTILVDESYEKCSLTYFPPNQSKTPHYIK